MIRPVGTFVATRELFTALDGDEPFGEVPLAHIYSSVAHGGAPLIEAYRIEGFPKACVCHAELRRVFYDLKSRLEAEIPDAKFKAIFNPASHAEWTGTEYEKAIELLSLSWDDDEHHIDLVCMLSEDGGRIDLLRDGEMEIGRSK